MRFAPTTQPNGPTTHWQSPPRSDATFGAGPRAGRSANGRTRRRSCRRAMTLVEMLVATALSLIIVLAVTQVFRLVGDNILSSRAVAEMSSQLRATSNQLRADLGKVTVPVRPWTDATSGLGYFELYEGPFWDMEQNNVKNPSTFGDFDDVLMFTVRAKGEPFTGQVMGEVVPLPDGRLKLTYNPNERDAIESNIAEVAWFPRFDDRNGDSIADPGEVTLHRRIFLVLPNLDISDPSIQNLSPGQFYNGFDVSVRYQSEQGSTSYGGFTKYPNSLQTLSLRQNRTGHHVSGAFPILPSDQDSVIVQTFPYPLSPTLLAPQGTALNSDGELLPIDHEDFSWADQDWAAALGGSYGNDVILSQVLAFDVKVYDPEVGIRVAQAVPASESVGSGDYEAVLPGDPGYDQAGSVIGHGGYVDLFYERYLASAPPSPSVFSGLAAVRSGLRQQSPLAPAVYDTWTMFYECDGVDQNRILKQDLGFSSLLTRDSADWATDGIDNDGNGRVDDVGERETSPPYPVPLRGIEVSIRIIDPDSREVRQVTVASDFVPE